MDPEKSFLKITMLCASSVSQQHWSHCAKRILSQAYAKKEEEEKFFLEARTKTPLSLSRLVINGPKDQWCLLFGTPGDLIFKFMPTPRILDHCLCCLGPLMLKTKNRRRTRGGKPLLWMFSHWLSCWQMLIHCTAVFKMFAARQGPKNCWRSSEAKACSSLPLRSLPLLQYLECNACTSNCHVVPLGFKEPSGKN